MCRGCIRFGQHGAAGGPTYALSIVKGIKPRDQVEAMLAIQMAAIHLATIKAATNVSGSKNHEGFRAIRVRPE